MIQSIAISHFISYLSTLHTVITTTSNTQEQFAKAFEIFTNVHETNNVRNENFP